MGCFWPGTIAGDPTTAFHFRAYQRARIATSNDPARAFYGGFRVPDLPAELRNQINEEGMVMQQTIRIDGASLRSGQISCLPE